MLYPTSCARYIGTNGRMHGERKDANPATKATPKLTCVVSILCFYFLTAHYSTFHSIACGQVTRKGYHLNNFLQKGRRLAGLRTSCSSTPGGMPGSTRGAVGPSVSTPCSSVVTGSPAACDGEDVGIGTDTIGSLEEGWLIS